MLQATGVRADEALRNLDALDVGFDEMPSRVAARAAHLDTDIEVDGIWYM